MRFAGGRVPEHVGRYVNIAPLMEIVTSDEMKRIDRHAIRSMKIPSLDLMERAGRSVVEALVARCGSPAGRAILVLCGKGNNGGDGLVVARLLRALGCDPLALLVADPDSLAGDAAANLAKARAAGVRIETAATPRAWQSFRRRLGAFELFVDALLGTGLSGPAGGLVGQVISDLEKHRDARRREAKRPGAGVAPAPRSGRIRCSPGARPPRRPRPAGRVGRALRPLRRRRRSSLGALRRLRLRFPARPSTRTSRSPCAGPSSPTFFPRPASWPASSRSPTSASPTRRSRP